MKMYKINSLRQFNSQHSSSVGTYAQCTQNAFLKYIHNLLLCASNTNPQSSTSH